MDLALRLPPNSFMKTSLVALVCSICSQNTQLVRDLTNIVQRKIAEVPDNVAVDESILTTLVGAVQSGLAMKIFLETSLPKMLLTKLKVNLTTLLTELQDANSVPSETSAVVCINLLTFFSKMAATLYRAKLYLGGEEYKDIWRLLLATAAHKPSHDTESYLPTLNQAIFLFFQQCCQGQDENKCLLLDILLPELHSTAPTFGTIQHQLLSNIILGTEKVHVIIRAKPVSGTSPPLPPPDLPLLPCHHSQEYHPAYGIGKYVYLCSFPITACIETQFKVILEKLSSEKNETKGDLRDSDVSKSHPLEATSLLDDVFVDQWKTSYPSISYDSPPISQPLMVVKGKPKPVIKEDVSAKSSSSPLEFGLCLSGRREPLYLSWSGLTFGDVVQAFRSAFSCTKDLFAIPFLYHVSVNQKLISTPKDQGGEQSCIEGAPLKSYIHDIIPAQSKHSEADEDLLPRATATPQSALSGLKLLAESGGLAKLADLLPQLFGKYWPQYATKNTNDRLSMATTFFPPSAIPMHSLVMFGLCCRVPEYSAALRRLPGKEAEGMILIKVLLGTNMEEITAGELSSCMSLGET